MKLFFHITGLFSLLFIFSSCNIQDQNSKDQEAPHNTALPSINGTVAVGFTLSGENGTWTGNPAPAFSYQWKRDRVAISGATKQTYQLSQIDLNRNISLTVTASNSVGKAEATSLLSSRVAVAVQNKIVPVITGPTQLHQVLTSSNGVWDANPTPSFTYQWMRDNTVISSATGNTYTTSQEDVGSVISVMVTATTALGIGVASSLPTQAITSPPIIMIKPGISINGSNTPSVGTRLTSNTGTWIAYPLPTFSYSWFRSNGTNPEQIQGATNSTYTVVESDQNYSLLVKVVAQNDMGTTISESSPTQAVNSGPVNTIEPDISPKNPVVGTVINVQSKGTWIGNPQPTFKGYQWTRNDIAIQSATGSSYTTTNEDKGFVIRVMVTYTNSVGDSSVASLASLPVAFSPENNALPIISGTNNVGSSLTVTSGEWAAYPAPTINYQWKRGTTDIQGATANTYTLQDEDAGMGIKVLVTATNYLGAVSATSVSSPLVSAYPRNIDAPVLTGTAKVGAILSLSDGVWVAYPSNKTYNWYRDNQLLSETTNTYTIKGEDAGATIRGKVIITNTLGTGESYSLFSNIILGAPTNLVLPAISGNALVGSTLQGSVGSWASYPAPNFSYQWLKNTTAIPNATTKSYTILSADIGSRIQFKVTASNSEGSVSASITTTDAVTNTIQTPYIDHLTSTSRFDVTLPLGNQGKDVYFVFTNKNLVVSSPGPTIASVQATKSSQNNLSVNGKILPQPSPFMLANSATTNLAEKITMYNNTPPSRKAKVKSVPINKSIIAETNAGEDKKGDVSTFHIQRSGATDVEVPDLHVTNALVRKNVYLGDGRYRTLSIWVETAKYQSTITDTMVKDIADLFLSATNAPDIYKWTTAAIGEPWGEVDESNPNASYVIPWDSDKTITLLLADLNQSYSADSYVVGYFWGKDNIKVSEDARSNQRIMFYVDSTIFAKLARGEFTYAPTNYWPQIVFSVLAHEFQHMIQFYQKVVLHNVNSDTWLNEMSSLVLEDLLADKMNVAGPRGVKGTGGTGDIYNSNGRLPAFNYSPSISLLENYQFSLLNYSISYSFGAWLVRNYGGASLLRKIVQDPDGSTNAVLQAVRSYTGGSETLSDLLSKWAVAVLGSNRIDMSASYRYNTGTWFSSQSNSINYNLGSINFFNYYPALTIENNIVNSNIYPTANLYYEAGKKLTGTVTWSIDLPDSLAMTVFVTE